MKKLSFVVAVILLVSVVLAACGNSSTTTGGAPSEISIGYFPNLDHASAIVGLQKGFFEQELGDVKPNFLHFPNGNDFINALDTGDLDIGYVGPGPAINYFLDGGDVVILASAANGATLIVARNGSGIETIADLSGKSFCTPGNGCTHNVQLEKMLLDIDLKTNRVGGEVIHQPRIAPANMVALFESGDVDVAAAPEPWGTYLVEEGLGKVLVEWNDVEWGTELPSVVLVSSKKFVSENPEIVEKVLRAHVESVNFAQENTDETLTAVNERLYELTQQTLPENVLSKAWKRMLVSYDIEDGALQEWADASRELGFIEGETNLEGFVDTTILDKVLQ